MNTTQHTTKHNIQHNTVNEQELALIVAAKNGDAEAFWQLAENYRFYATNVAKAFVFNYEDAIDIVQDSFIKAWLAFDRFDTSAPFFPWMYRIIKNNCLNHIAQIQRRKVGSIEQIEEEDNVQFIDEAQNVFAHVERKDRNRYVMQAVKRLPKNFREIIIMYHFHDMSYQEIANYLNIPIGTVMSRLYNARKALKQIFESEHVVCV